MQNVSHRTLKLLAALVWYIGVVLLFIKGSTLAQDAHKLEPQAMGKTIAWVAGIIIGGVKTRFIFLNSCRRNMARIDALDTPKIWQFYRIRFFIALVLMIWFGSFLSWVSQGNHNFLVAVAILDISIGFALLLSSQVFFKQKLLFSKS
ncbi:hypothetical protein HQ531_13190 [bacterium]|nr:hypothetical protein [bacterium]